MKKINSVDIVQETKNEILHACASGKWEQKLPGSRVLAKQLGVSAPTVIKALRELAGEGVLHRAGDRKAYTVTKKAKAVGRRTKNQRKVILLAPEPFTGLADSVQETTRLIIQTLRRRGIVPERKVVDYKHSRSVQRNWETLIEADERTRLIAFYGNSLLETWVTERNIPTIFLGGNVTGTHVSMIAVRLIPMVKHAITELTSLGHQHIVLPLHDWNDQYATPIKEATRAAIEAVGTPYVERYHNPESAYSLPDVTYRMLESIFAVRQPTAMIFLRFSELIAAHCFLSRMGLRVPEDISLILLSYQPEVEWFTPQVAHHRFPNEETAKQACKWVKGAKKEQLLSYPTTRYVPGNSTAAPVH